MSEARLCSHCGCMTTDWIAHDRDDDRGPLQLLWCRDSAACVKARRRASRQSSTRAGGASRGGP